MDILFGDEGEDYLDGSDDEHMDLLLGGIGPDLFIQHWKQNEATSKYQDFMWDFNGFEGDTAQFPK